MEFKLIVVCLVLMTIWRITDAQTVDTKNPNKNPVNQFIEEHDDQHDHKIGLQQGKQGAESKLQHTTDGTKITRVQNITPKPKSAQSTPNLASDKKPGMSIKKPILIKISNIKQAPANHNMPSVKRKNPQIINTKEGAPRRKIVAYNNSHPKTRVVIKKVKQTPPKSTQYFEEEVDHDHVKSFSSAAKLPSATEASKPAKNKTLLNILKSNDVNIEASIDLRKDAGQSKDELPVELTKQKPKHPDSPKTDHSESSKAHKYDKTEPTLVDDLKSQRKATTAPKEDKSIPPTTDMSKINSTSDDSENIAHPISNSREEDDDEPEIITIRNHEHKEIEERFGENPDQPYETSIVEDTTQKWTAKTIDPESDNNYNYQAPYEQNLDNQYPYQEDRTTCNCINTAKSDYIQDYAVSNISPSEAEMYPNVFHDWPQPQNDALWPQNNPKWSQPQNSGILQSRFPKVAGRTWKTWQDTEIKIRKLNNKQYLGNNLINSGAITPVSYKNPAIGLNGYYDNLNNPFTYAYPSYRYVK